MTALSTPSQTGPERAAARPIPSGSNRLDRQVMVELRKAVDTRSGVALVLITGLLAMIVTAVIIALTRVSPSALSFDDVVQAAGGGTAMLLPVIGILLVTSEWSQRTTLTTFVLEPRRLRVLGAKIIAGLVIALASGGVVLLIAIVATPVAAMVGDSPPDWSFSTATFAAFLGQQAVGVCAGVALAALILNTPGAIVAYIGYQLVLPFVMPMLNIWHPAHRIYPWVDFSAAQTKLTETGLSATDWAHLVVAGSIWLVVPLVAGAIRIRRSDVS